MLFIINKNKLAKKIIITLDLINKNINIKNKKIKDKIKNKRIKNKKKN